MKVTVTGAYIEKLNTWKWRIFPRKNDDDDYDNNRNNNCIIIV